MNSKETQKIDISLDRDPRRARAKASYTEMQARMNATERKYNSALANLGSVDDNRRTKLQQEAAALLSGGEAPTRFDREALTKSLEELSHQRAVEREATAMAKRKLEELDGEISKAIATDVLPQHRAIVTRIADAVFQLDAVLQEEQDLRDALYDNGVAYSGVIRSTQFPGWGRLSSPYSRVTNFILSLYEDDLIPLSKIPEKLVPYAKAKKHKTEPVKALAVSNADGWEGVA